MADQYRLYLHPNGFFYHRVKVPVDIRNYYGKQIEQRSLRTRVFRDAVRLLAAVVVEVDEMFARCRAEHAEALEAGPRARAERHNRSNLGRYVVEYGEYVFAEEYRRRSAAYQAVSQDERCGDQITLALAHRSHVHSQLLAIQQDWAIGNFERWENVADTCAPNLDAARRATLIRALFSVELKTLEGWQKHFEHSPNPELKSTVEASVAPIGAVVVGAKPEVKAIELPLMSSISQECFEAIGREKNWSAKTESARRTQIKQFIEVCGDKPLNRYTQNDIRRLKTTLFALPPQAHAKKEFAGMTKSELAEYARQRGISGLSAESVRQIMTAPNIVYGWARAEYDNTLQNIVQPMIPSPSSVGGKRSKRQGFSAEELQNLFTTPVFTGVESEAAWLRPGSVRMHHTGRFWVPLLALFAGMRLMEAVQLLRADVGCQSNIWFLDINDGDVDDVSKRVKNPSSVRRIPVHPVLTELGFLNFVSTVQEGERLFPDIPIGPATQRHRYASKMFNKLLRVAGIKSSQKVWHSLRHGFEQACRDSRVDSAVMDQLQGHAQKGMRSIYGDGYGLDALYDGVRSIRYDGLNLAHIQPLGSITPLAKGHEAASGQAYF
ncbi:MAG: site-specific integrase [Hydrogenophaga sp.]|nr:site-specific integrase [Hydrogenophaga sp.]